MGPNLLDHTDLDGIPKGLTPVPSLSTIQRYLNPSPVCYLRCWIARHLLVLALSIAAAAPRPDLLHWVLMAVLPMVATRIHSPDTSHPNLRPIHLQHRIH